MNYNNLIIIGTSHIAKQSLKEVNDMFENENPDIIALELDRKRIYSLLEKKKTGPSLRDIKRIGLKGFLFSLIGAWVEKKLGEKVGVSPGSEMLEAFKLAKSRKIKIFLIDQDIEITLKRFSKALTWREKWNFVVDLIKGLIFKKQEFSFDLEKVPSRNLIKNLIKKVKQRYPNIYKVLIEERNQVMARNLFQIMQKYPESKIVAIVGAGHEEDILGIIKSANLQ